MYALPPGLESSEQPMLTGLGCPACHGVLSVERQGRRLVLAFTCRIGHTFATDELLTALEEQREAILWSAVTAYEQLVTLLEQLEPRTTPAHRDRLLERRACARERLADLRRLIQEDTPIELDGDPGVPATGPSGDGAPR